MELTNDVLYAVAPYAEMLGIDIEETTKSQVKVRLAHRTELRTIGGSMHGGALMSLCDVTAALCAAMNVEPGETTTTAESTTYFLRPLFGELAIAIGRPVKIGRTLICVEVDVEDASGQHCVRTTQMLAVKRS